MLEMELSGFEAVLIWDTRIADNCSSCYTSASFLRLNAGGYSGAATVRSQVALLPIQHPVNGLRKQQTGPMTWDPVRDLQEALGSWLQPDSALVIWGVYQQLDFSLSLSPCLLPSLPLCLPPSSSLCNFVF